ncbi:peptidoglycan D,D-transpeptidase FtsI family protein [Nocardioides sp. DS6]|uniref:Peptidoglycan D,D-transpeptidase FtsI family protein n=1 Tax=Nocardioides eburneus TaxID=3231482 RepID=A0ABV3SX09_9ACTN
MRSAARLDVRLRVGFVVIAMILSVFGARLVQLQGFDPHAYAAAAAKENLVDVVLPAERGDILDRNGEPLADSVDGLMVIADPSLTSQHAAELATLLSKRLKIDYAATLAKLRKTSGAGSRFQYVARNVPATLATAAVQAAEKKGYDGLTTERDPIRDYPAGDVAANLVGFIGTDGPLAGMELAFNKHLAGKDGKATYEQDKAAGGTRIPLGKSSRVNPIDGQNLTLTIDRDLQWYSQRVLMKAVQDANAESGMAIVMDTKTGEVLTQADYPTYNAQDPGATPQKYRGVPSLSDPYEPGSVEKVLTLSALIDAGKVTDRTKLTVPGEYKSGDAYIHDWWAHGTVKLTLAGVIAQSSNIGTVLASNKFKKGQLRDYLVKFGLGQRTNVGLAGESAGLLPSTSVWNDADEDRIDFGQSLSVNALQEAAAVNTIADGGVRIDPSLVIGHATNDAGVEVGTDTATRRRVVSAAAAKQMSLMMERVVDPVAGLAPKAGVPGYRVAGKTGTAQRVSTKCHCYDGTFTVSFAGFAPADNPRFTIYVVVQNPRNGGGGGSVAGPVFSKIMGFALRRYGVPPTNTPASKLPTTW